jgi:hypothetical protein
MNAGLSIVSSISRWSFLFLGVVLYDAATLIECGEVENCLARIFRG